MKMKTLLEQENGALEVTSTIESMLKQKTLEAIEETRKQVAADTFSMNFESADSELQEAIEAAYNGEEQLDEWPKADTTVDHPLAKELASKALYNHKEYHNGNHDATHGGWAMHDLHTWAKNYARKKDKGVYDKELAVKGLTHAIKNSEASTFGKPHGTKHGQKITGATRTQAARHLLPHVEKLMKQHQKPVKEEKIVETTKISKSEDPMGVAGTLGLTTKDPWEENKKRAALPIGLWKHPSTSKKKKFSLLYKPKKKSKARLTEKPVTEEETIDQHCGGCKKDLTKHHGQIYRFSVPSMPIGNYRSVDFCSTKCATLDAMKNKVNETEAHYTGHKDGKVERFSSNTPPTQKSHGHLYNAVTGPFKTKRAADWAVKNQGNPHFHHVNDAEKLSKLEVNELYSDSLIRHLDRDPRASEQKPKTNTTLAILKKLHAANYPKFEVSPDIQKEEEFNEGRKPHKNPLMHARLTDHGFEYKGTNSGFQHYKNSEGHRIKHKFPTPNGNHSFTHEDPSGKVVWKSPSASDTEIHKHLEKHFPTGKLGEARDPFGFGKKHLAQLGVVDKIIKKQVAAKKTPSTFQRDLDDWRKHDRGAIPKGKLGEEDITEFQGYGPADPNHPLNRNLAQNRSNSPITRKVAPSKFGYKPVDPNHPLNRTEAEQPHKLDTPSPEEAKKHFKWAQQVRTKASKGQGEFDNKWKSAKTDKEKHALKVHAFQNNYNIPWEQGVNVRSRSPIHDFATEEEVNEEYLTEISQAIPWPARSKHLGSYTRKKGEEGAYNHPEGHKLELHKDAEGKPNGEWTHTTKDGKVKKGTGIGNLHVHLMKTHGNFDERVKHHMQNTGVNSLSHAMGALSYKHHKKHEGDPEDNAVEYKAMHKADMNLSKRDRGVR
jgi:hypothetical protein